MTDSYAGLSRHYDLVMTSGYYDYEAYTSALLRIVGHRRHVLEIGVGTGLVCERLASRGSAALRLTGLDHSESMLAQARQRLGPGVELRCQDVRDAEPPLPSGLEVAFSVGGVWAFLDGAGGDADAEGEGEGEGDGGGGGDGDGAGGGTGGGTGASAATFCSLLPEDGDNTAALRNLRAALDPGSTLAVAVQAPHRDLERELPGGLTYVQRVRPSDGGRRLTKEYVIRRRDEILARQSSRLRLYGRHEAALLLARSGFRADGVTDDGLFHLFTRL